MPESYQIDCNQYEGCTKVHSTPASRGLAPGSFVFIPVTHAVFIRPKRSQITLQGPMNVIQVLTDSSLIKPVTWTGKGSRLSLSNPNKWCYVFDWGTFWWRWIHKIHTHNHDTTRRSHILNLFNISHIWFIYKRQWLCDIKLCFCKINMRNKCVPEA